MIGFTSERFKKIKRLTNINIRTFIQLLNIRDVKNRITFLKSLLLCSSLPMRSHVSKYSVNTIPENHDQID